MLGPDRLHDGFLRVPARVDQLHVHRTAIEEQIRNGIADLTLNEAAAVLMLSSDVRKLLEMTKTMEGLAGEDLVKFCADNDVAMLSGNIFNAPEPTEEQRLEWEIFILFLARWCRFSVEGAYGHAEWVQSRGTLLADWMKPNSIRDSWMPIQQKTFDGWNAFLENNRHRALQDVSVELSELQARDEERATKKRARAPRRGQS